MIINCLLIDDEPLALDKLEQYARKVPYLNLAGRFENAIHGLEVLKQTPIELMYLDINMPDVSGIEFLRGLQSPPKVILTTAYNHYALEGFELNVVDYLLKPFSFDRFLKATDRAYETLAAKAEIRPDPKPDDFIFIKAEHNLIKVNFSEIDFIEGLKDYVKVYTSMGKPYLSITSLKSLEQLLPTNRLLRIHKSFIISIDKIETIRSGKVLIKGRWIAIGESYQEAFDSFVLKGRMG